MTKEEAINKVRQMSLPKETMEILQALAPELTESDDERIRKFLVEIFSHGIWQKEWPFGPNEVVAWLEKQKEQKPRKFKLGDKVHWYDDDTNVITITGFRDDAYLTDSAYGPILFCDEDNWERIEQKPAEWSEEDERMRNVAIRSCEQTIEDHPSDIVRFKDCINWLKSLRPQPHWKPSEEQLEVLLNAEGLVRANNYPENAKILASLYEQLKKL